MASNNEQNASPSIGEDDEISQSNSTSSSTATLSPASNVGEKTKKEADATHSLKFESKLMTLICVRALEAGCIFRLAKEREDLGGKFDDGIFQYQVLDDTPEGKHWRYHYLQAKHKQNESDKINATHLLEDNDKGDFSLPKYFRFFCKMRGRGEDIHDFTLFTNIGFDLKDVQEKDIELVPINAQPEDIIEFVPQQKTLHYKMKFTKELRSKALNEWSDIDHLAKKLQTCAQDQTTTDTRIGVFSSYRVALIKERVIDFATKRFHVDFVNDAEDLSNGAQQLRQTIGDFAESNWKNWKFNLNNTFGKSQSAAEMEIPLPLKIKEEDIDAFLDKFVFVVNTPNEEQFEAILQTQDVSKYYPEDECKQQTIRLLHEISAKFSNKEMGYWLTSEEAKKILLAGVTNISREYQAKLEKEVGFNKVAKKDMAIKLKSFLDSSKKFERITTSSPRHTAVKVISAIPILGREYPSVSHLVASSSQLQAVEDAERWKNIVQLPNDASHFLLVVCDDGEQPLQDEHYAKLFLGEEGKTKRKKVIVISRKKLEITDHIIDEINYMQLEESFKQKILSKIVSFQGENVSVKQLVGAEPEEVIDSLEELLRTEGGPITIPSFDTSRFEKSLYIKRRVKFAFGENFYAKLANSSNYFEENYKISAQGQVQGFFDDQFHKQMWENIQIINDQTPGNIEEDGHLIHFDAERKEQPVIIICGVAGTGKSTLLSHYYSEIKEKKPDCWVIKLNLVQHCDAILKLNRKRPDLTEFLIDHLRVVDNQSPFSRSLLNHRLETGDRIVLMFDGFDEISDECQEIAIQLMRVIQKKKGVQLYVTTRTHMAHHLQYELNQLAYYLENFNENDQICYLASHWTSESQLPENGAIEEFAKALVDRVSETLKDKEKALIGIPLQCRILADCYQQNVTDVVRNNDVTLQSGELVSQKLLALLDNQKFDLISLYSQLMDTKRKVFREEKTNTAICNQIVADAFEILIKKIESRLTKLAVEIIITEPNVLEMFWPRKSSHKSTEDLDREEKILAENSLKLGLTFSRGNEMRPEFLHRTFAEYLVAKHLYEGFHLDDKRHNKLLENESIRKLILNKILDSKQYDGVQLFFDCMVRKLVDEDVEWRCQINRRQLPDRLKKWTENLFTQVRRSSPPLWATVDRPILMDFRPYFANALHYSLSNGKGNIFLLLCDCLDATFGRQQIYWAMRKSFLSLSFPMTFFKESKIFKRFIDYFDIDPANSSTYEFMDELLEGMFPFGSPDVVISFWNRDEHQQTMSDLLQFLEHQQVAFNEYVRIERKQEFVVPQTLELLICIENCRIHLETFLKLLSKTTAYSDDVKFAKLLMEVFDFKDHLKPGQVAKTLDVLHGLGRPSLLIQLYGRVAAIEPEAFQNIYQPRRLENVDAIPADLDKLLERDPYGMTCLHGAAFHGDVEILDQMFARFAQLELNAEAKQAVRQVLLEDYTPFYFAATKSHEKICSSLLVFVKDMFPDALTDELTVLKGFIRRSLDRAMTSKNVEMFQLISKVVKKELGHEYLRDLLVATGDRTSLLPSVPIFYNCRSENVFIAMVKIIVDRDGTADYKCLYDLIFNGKQRVSNTLKYVDAEHLRGLLSVEGAGSFTKRVLDAPQSLSDDFRLLSKMLRNFNRTQLLDFVKTITLEPMTPNDDGTTTVHAERAVPRNSIWRNFLRRTMEFSAFSSPSREDVDCILECLTCVSDQLGGDCAKELLLYRDYVLIDLSPIIKLMLERLPENSREEIKQQWKTDVPPMTKDSFISFNSSWPIRIAANAKHYSDVLQFYLDYGSEMQRGQCVDILTSVRLINGERHSVWSFIFRYRNVTKTNELLKSVLDTFGREVAKKLLLHEVDRFPVILKALSWGEDIDGRLETLPQEIRRDIQQVVARNAVQLIDDVFLHHKDYFKPPEIRNYYFKSPGKQHYKRLNILIFAIKYSNAQQLEQFVKNITTLQVSTRRGKTHSIWGEILAHPCEEAKTNTVANMNRFLKCVSQRLGTNAVEELVLHQIEDHPSIYYPAVRGEEKMEEAMLAHLDAENRKKIQRQVNEFLDKTFDVPSDNDAMLKQ